MKQVIKIKIWDREENKDTLKICKLTKEMKEEHPYKSEYSFSRQSNKETIYEKSPKEENKIRLMMGACQVLIDNTDDSRLTLYKIIKNQMMGTGIIPSLSNMRTFCKGAKNQTEECNQFIDLDNFMKKKLCPHLDKVGEYLSFLFNKGFKFGDLYNTFREINWKYNKYC